MRRRYQTCEWEGCGRVAVGFRRFFRLNDFVTTWLCRRHQRWWDRGCRRRGRWQARELEFEG